MVLEPEPAARPAPTIPLASPPGAYVAVLAAMLIVLFLCWGPLSAWAGVAASSFMR
jgi:hypothetical protein